MKAKKILKFSLVFLLIFTSGAFSSLYEKQPDKSWVKSARDRIGLKLPHFSVFDKKFPEQAQSLRYNFYIKNRYDIKSNFQITENDAGEIFAIDRNSGALYSLNSNSNKMKIKGNLFDSITNKYKEIASVNNLVMDLHFAFDKFFVSIVTLRNNGKSECLTAYDFELNGNSIIKVNKFFESPCIEDRQNTSMWAGRFASSTQNLYLSIGEQRYDRSGFPKNSSIAETERLNTKSVFGTILKFSPNLLQYNIFSKGHRNAQGLFYSSLQNKLFESEHGPSGGDEINLIEQGKNYGWPQVSFGNAYGWPVTDGLPYKFNVEAANTKYELELKKYGFIRGSHEGYTLPLMSWSPSIAASALREVPDSSYLSGWKGDIILATLSEKSLHRIVIKNNIVVLDERIALNFRIRDFVLTNTGLIFIATDEGQLVSMKLVANN